MILTFIVRANIPKSSKLDDIMTLLKLFELFFDDLLVDMIIGFTNLYKSRHYF